MKCSGDLRCDSLEKRLGKTAASLVDEGTAAVRTGWSVCPQHTQECPGKSFGGRWALLWASCSPSCPVWLGEDQDQGFLESRASGLL